MTESPPDPATSKIDWEAFYRDYRKPGYIPGYEITSKLGGGMFGLVFKARKQSIGKDYAIKFLKVDDDEIRRALVTELESVRHFAQVDHPNLVSIEDRGEVDGIPYIVMTYAGDQTLRDRLSDEDRDVEQLLLFFLQACRGVHALHERSLVHFDLKPANVFLRGNVARVGDYGLSKLVAHSRNTLSMGRGTPYYMAPEILQNKGDLRSDVYSLGVILFECLTGEVPFTGESEWEVLRKHEQAEPSYPDDMAPQYREVIARCLAKNPADRFQSVAELVSALTQPAGTRSSAGSERAAGTGEGTATGSEEDPFKDFKEAARVLGEQAKKAASEAVRSAQVMGRRAVRQARHVVEQKRRDVSWNAGLWSARSWRRLRTQLRGGQFWHEWRRRNRERREQRRLRRARLRRSGFGVLAVFVLLAFLGWVSVAGGVAVRPSASSSSSSYTSETSNAVTTVTVASESPAFAAWIPAAKRGDPGAPALLRASLAAFRQELPTHPAALQSRRSPLPEYPLHVVATENDLERALAAAEAVAAGESDGDPAAALDAAGYVGVTTAIQLLEDQSMLEPEGLQRAERLNRFLTRTFGFDGISVTTELAQQPIDPYFPLNDRVGQLWRWFVHEFAPDPQTYGLYRKTSR